MSHAFQTIFSYYLYKRFLLYICELKDQFPLNIFFRLWKSILLFPWSFGFLWNFSILCYYNTNDVRFPYKLDVDLSNTYLSQTESSFWLKTKHFLLKVRIFYMLRFTYLPMCFSQFFLYKYPLNTVSSTYLILLSFCLL